MNVLPWVSRRAYDMLALESRRKDTIIDKLLDHQTRMERVERGLPERTPVTKAPRPELPVEFAQILNGFDNQTVRDQWEQEIRKALSKGDTTGLLNDLKQHFGLAEE